MTKQLASTSMSSGGQVVIPEEIRKTLKLQAGAQFVVFCDKDVVILKMVTPPSMNDFDTLIKKARVQARKSGIRKADVNAAIIKVRKK